MNRGIYTSASGMMVEMVRTDTIANNLANCNTAGYKKDINISKDFNSMLIERIRDGENPAPQIGHLGTGPVAWENFVVHQKGGFIEAGSPLSAAIGGSGYFTVETPAGVRYTRNGTFTLNSEGTIVTMDGYPVLSAAGASITVFDNQPVHIGNDGRVFNGNQEIAQLGLVDVENTRALRKEAGVFFRLEDESQIRPFTGKVFGGMLEVSNVNVIEEMVNLIASYRAYEINAKGVQTHDQLNEKAVNDVGRA
ncbi:MAG: flagellar hook-basal body protein [Acidaminococcales bacterium]|nr:flagellar hook-basal body protein [Acidaminococcales bacterium]